MLNKTVLLSRLTNKIQTDLFVSIVDEAFINALPFTEADMTPQMQTRFSDFTSATLESMGGINVLTKAIENPHNTTSQRNFLSDILMICHESAANCAMRIAAETDLKEATMGDVEKIAELNDKENEEFVAKAKNMHLETISDVIQDKTIAVIKAEKEALLKDEELNQKLKNAVSGESDEDSSLGDEALEEAVESVYRIAVAKNLPRNHVSLFSKLHDVAMESCIMSGEKYDHSTEQFPLSTLKDTMINRTLNLFPNKPNPASAFESAVSYSNIPADAGATMKDNNDAAMISAVAMYTMYETLQTMNLAKLSRDEVKTFIESPCDIKKDTEATKEAMANSLMIKLESLRRAILRATDVASCETFETTLTTLEKSDSPVIVEILPEINTLKSLVDTRKNEIRSRESVKELSVYEQRRMDETVAKMDGLVNYFAKPDVVGLKFMLDEKNGPQQIINVNVIGAGGSRCDTTFVPVPTDACFGNIRQYLKNCYSKSKLSKTDKLVQLYDCTTGLTTAI